MIVFYTSAHGFGHASRDIEVMNALGRERPDVPIVVRSTVPAWFFDISSRRPLDVRPLETDSGVAQNDGLSLDEEETAQRARRFYEHFDEHVDREAVWLRAHAANVVIADIPPLAPAAALRADVPSVAIANFTWDWIYRGFPGFEARAPGVLEVITTAYSQTTHALRLPLHGGFASMRPVVRDIPLVARRSTLGRDAARRAIGLGDDKPIVLVSFGGHGVRLPLEAVAATNDVTLLLTDFEAAPNEAGKSVANVKCVSPQNRAERGLYYEDLVAAADVVVSKPGYGIISECVANDTALLYTSRGRLIEYDILVAEMPGMLRCRFIAQEDLLAGRWAERVHALLHQPRPPVTPMTNGAEVAAEFILRTARL